MTLPAKRRLHVLLNPGARQVRAKEEIEKAYEPLASEIADLRVEQCEHGRELVPRARAAASGPADAVIAVGGDGTINSVASALVGTEKALGVLPLGTFNHFAKDSGLPLELPAAAEATVRGGVRRVDVGFANDRPFLNTATLGVYFDAVTTRERWQPRVGKLLATIFGMLHVLRHPPVLKLDVDVDGKRMRARVPVIWVGNNRYEMEWPATGKRSRLDEGLLTLVIVHETSRTAFLHQVIRVLLGKSHLAKDIDLSVPREVVVRSRSHHLRVALDGERLHLRSPLTLRVKPGALKLLVPLEPGTKPEA